VPEFPPPPPPPLPPPPHPIAAAETKKTSRPSIEIQFRRRAGIPKKKTIARAAPPADGQNDFTGLFSAVVGAVVVMVKVEVCAEAPLIVTDAGLRVQVAGSVAPLGPETEQVNATAPVNPPVGVTVIVDVFPLVAPGLKLMLPLLLRPKLGGTAAVTVTATDVVAVIAGEVEVPLTVTV